MHLLPPSVVLPIDVTSRLSGMCTSITLGRPQVERLQLRFLLLFSSVPSYQQEYNVANKVTYSLTYTIYIFNNLYSMFI